MDSAAFQGFRSETDPHARAMALVLLRQAFEAGAKWRGGEIVRIPKDDPDRVRDGTPASDYAGREQADKTPKPGHPWTRTPINTGEDGGFRAE